MWPFKKCDINSSTLTKEINDLSKKLEKKITADTYPTDDPKTRQIADFLNSLGADLDISVFQTLQTNFARAAERYKHDEARLLVILQDWCESLKILHIVQDGNETKFPQIKLKTQEIERRLKDLLGNDYIIYERATKNTRKV